MDNLDLAVFGTVTAYVVVAVLLLSLNIASLWRWWIKAGAMVVTTGFFVGTYAAITSLLGWPTPDEMPPRVNFLWSRIIEPNKASGAPGAIYVWAETLTDENIPVGEPRAFRLPYTDLVAGQVNGAQEMRQEGKEVLAKFEYKKQDSQLGKEGDEEGEVKLVKMNVGDQNAAGVDSVPFKNDSLYVTFEELPPVPLPDKGPIFIDQIRPPQ